MLKFIIKIYVWCLLPFAMTCALVIGDWVALIGVAFAMIVSIVVVIIVNGGWRERP